MKTRLFVALFVTTLPIAATIASLPDTATRLDPTEKKVAAFVDEMVTEHEFDRDELQALLGQAEIKQSILDLISAPAEKKLTWAEYRKIFITPERVAAGAAFWRDNEAMLQRIATETGVPVEMLVGIIGVETYFGRITGGNRVIDALSTLAFAYPPRAKFFRKELVEFLLLAREEGIDALQPTGSYAGAMGRPQFMPSSYRAYAVDASGDGKRDIWENWTDVAGSIANYFVAHGWRQGDGVAAQATLGSQWDGAPPQPKNRLKATQSVAALSRQGVVFATGLPNKSAAELMSFEGSDGLEFWVGFHNFFVITKYNRSSMYALAVYQLGQEIRAAVEADGA